MNASILTVCGTALTGEERAFLREAQPWGLILMGRSLVTPSQVRALVDDIWNTLQRRCLVFIDQEGGRVARLKAPEWPQFPPAAAFGTLYDIAPERGLEACRLAHRLMAHELSALGIHGDCAPVLDVPVPGAHDIIADRAFSHAPETVTALGRAALEGLQAGGVAGVVKHIPGHGRARNDSHFALPRVNDGRDALAQDFAPFAALADAPMAMTAHIAYDAIDPDVPATLSSKLVSQVIRRRIGFEGLVMSDDLDMKALGGSLGARASGAIEAGCDVVLLALGFLSEPADILSRMREVVAATPQLSGEALARAQRADAAAGRIPDDFDPDAARMRLDTLMDSAGLRA